MLRKHGNIETSAATLGLRTGIVPEVAEDCPKGSTPVSGFGSSFAGVPHAVRTSSAHPASTRKRAVIKGDTAEIGIARGMLTCRQVHHFVKRPGGSDFDLDRLVASAAGHLLA